MIYLVIHRYLLINHNATLPPTYKLGGDPYKGHMLTLALRRVRGLHDARGHKASNFSRLLCVVMWPRVGLMSRCNERRGLREESDEYLQ